jgi:Protein-glutamine gamma-glutamyltransferase
VTRSRGAYKSRRYETIGLETKPGVSSSDAIRDIFKDPKNYSVDCASFVYVVWFKAILDTMIQFDTEGGKGKFDKLFPTITLWAEGTSGADLNRNGKPDGPFKRHLLIPVTTAMGLVGDTMPVQAPHQSNPAWQTENMVQSENGVMEDATKIVAHGMPKARTVNDVVTALRGKPDPENRARVKASVINKAIGP